MNISRFIFTGLLVLASLLPATALQRNPGFGAMFMQHLDNLGFGAYGPFPRFPVISPSPYMRTNANIPGAYVNPRTNMVVLSNRNLPADHFIPQSWIRQLPGFGRLTPGQQSWLLNHPLNTQPLPQTFNSSKGALMPSDWQQYKGQPLDPGYIYENWQREQLLKPWFQQQVNSFNQVNGGG